MTIKNLILLIAVYAFSLRAAPGQDLSNLSYDDQRSIETACVFAKGSGPATYHNCLNRQLTELGDSKAPDISHLSYDDQRSVETACVFAKGSGPATYHNCLNRQLAELGDSKAPDISHLSYDDQGSIETACVFAKGSGPATYHNCLNRQLGQVKTAPAPAKILSGSENGCAYLRPFGEGPYNACVQHELSQQKLNTSAIPASTLIPSSHASTSTSSPVPGHATPTSSSGICAENGSCYGDISPSTGLPKTVAVHGYYRRDGTYVRGYYRSK